MQKIIAIVQARLGSKRLNSKVLKILYKQPLLSHVIERLRASKKIDQIVLATTDKSEDKPLTSLALKLGIGVYTGSEYNVLERFYYAAKRYDGDIIVRITADDPFKDPEIIDRGIDIFLSSQEFDYVSNTIYPTYPEGLDVEIFTFKSLEKAYNANDLLLSDKEHVTPYIWKNPQKFKLYNFRYKENLSHLRWTIDYKEDYFFAKKVYEKLYPIKKIFNKDDILHLCHDDSEVLLMEPKGRERNEGYKKSTRLDKHHEKN